VLAAMATSCSGDSRPAVADDRARQALLLNCLCYISKFDGARPLDRKQASARLVAVHLASVSDKISDPNFRTRTFAPELLAKSKGDAQGLTKCYRDNLELIYYDKVFRVDEDLRLLGLKSNRRLETLQRLIELLGDPSQAAAAGKALRRYTQESFETPEAWRAWFEENRDRIYFTDVGATSSSSHRKGTPPHTAAARALAAASGKPDQRRCPLGKMNHNQSCDALPAPPADNAGPLPWRAILRWNLLIVLWGIPLYGLGLIIHELGHAGAAGLVGLQAYGISFAFLSPIIESRETCFQDFVISIGGVALASLSAALVLPFCLPLRPPS